MLLEETATRGRQPGGNDVLARYRLNDLYCSMWLALSISALCRERVFDHITESGNSAADIAGRCDLNAPALSRVLRALAVNGILRVVGPNLFAHTDISRLLSWDHPCSWAGMAKMWGHRVALRSWEQFSAALTDGNSGILHAYGKELYDYLHTDPEATTAFSDAMISNSAHASAAIAEVFPFSNYKSVVDLGGGVGTLLLSIARRHAGLRAVLFEVEDLRKEAEAYLRANNMYERIEIVSGSFLDNVPPDIDVYLVKNSLWNWDDSRCLQIMKNVRSAIGDDLDKRFVVIEYVISDENASWSTLYDLQILNLPGGRARTRCEYEALFEQSGFALEHMLFAEDQTLLVARPISLGLLD